MLRLTTSCACAWLALKIEIRTLSLLSFAFRRQDLTSLAAPQKNFQVLQVCVRRRNLAERSSELGASSLGVIVWKFVLA